MPHESCQYCDGAVEQRTVRARFHYQKQLVFIDHVPAWECTRCGEQYFDAPVYRRLEEIAKNRDRITKTVSFPLAEYDAAPV